jgi:hypothetical protein
MAKRVLLVLSLFLYGFNVQAQRDSLLAFSSIKRGLQLSVLEDVYLGTPVLIDKSTISQYVVGSLGYNYSDGGLKHPQDYKKHNGFELATSSLAPLKGTDWVLYGSLRYVNYRDEQVETNLSYRINEHNSPYYLFQKRTGLWNHQNYGFEVVGMNKIDEVWSIGGALTYDTHLYYRKSDTRNEGVALDIETSLSVGFTHGSHTVAATMDFGFLKTDASLGNKFPINNRDSEYNVYLNGGLGTYKKISGNSHNFETERVLPELRLQWLGKKGGNEFSVVSETRFGAEKWINRNANRLDQNNELGRYSFVHKNFSFWYAKFWDTGNMLTLKLDGGYLDGESEFLNETTGVYLSNYTSDRMELGFSADFYNRRSLISGIGLSMDYTANGRFDRNYAYTFDDAYLSPGLYLAIEKDITKQVILSSRFDVSYTHVVEVDHNPFAADNIYVDWIGNRLADYYGTSTYGLGNSTSCNIVLENNNVLELGFSVSIDKVGQIPDYNSITGSESDDYYSTGLFVKWFF